jgi:hypothetical protein
MTIVKKLGSVAMSMLIELFTARFIRKTIKQGFEYITKKTETTVDDKLLEAAEKEGIFDPKEEKGE